MLIGDITHAMGDARMIEGTKQWASYEFS